MVVIDWGRVLENELESQDVEDWERLQHASTSTSRQRPASHSTSLHDISFRLTVLLMLYT